MEDDMQPEPTSTDFSEGPKLVENFEIGTIKVGDDIDSYEEISDTAATFEDEEGGEGDGEAGPRSEKDDFQDELDYDPDEWAYADDEVEVPMGV